MVVEPDGGRDRPLFHVLTLLSVVLISTARRFKHRHFARGASLNFAPTEAISLTRNLQGL
jgi:hypothetical protein